MDGEERRNVKAASGRQSCLLLGIGTLLAAFSNGNYAIPAAAWIAPVFIMRFMRSHSIRIGSPLALGALTLASTSITWNMLSLGLLPPSLRILAGLVWGVRFFLPFMADRILSPRLKGFRATLVFPLTWTTMEYMYSLTVEGTWGALAYTQYGNLPLIQLASVTGIWGIAFLMTWFASVVNWVWEQEFKWERVRRGVFLYAGVLALVLFSGGARLSLFPPESKTVCVAAITKSEPFSSFFDVHGKRESVCKSSKEERLHFLTQSRRAAKAGAGIVTWQEHAVFIREEEETDFVEECRQMAQDEGIYLIMAYNTYPLDFPSAPWKNKLTGIDRSGRIMWEYLKSYPSMALEPGLPPGDRKAPLMDTIHGKIGSVICTDQEHPELIRQAGKDRSFLLLIPSADWKGVTPLHTQMAALRAVENGCAIVKAAGNGLSAAFDHQGRVLSTLDYYRTKEQSVMLAHVPTQSSATLYTKIGDGFAWLCAAGLTVLVVIALRGQRKP
jgi:apolipoprotein N-acyltransferase